MTDVCRPFTEILLDLQASGEEISEMEFNSALDEIANEVKLRVVRKARAEEFSDLCRVCLMHIQPTTAISDILEDNITIADELEHLFELHKNSIRIGDDFPQKLCNFCLEKSSEELKKECLESMQIMQDSFDVDLLTLQDPVCLIIFYLI